MLVRNLTLLAASLLAVGSLPAANIAWISPHPADNTPSTAVANFGLTTASDVGYTALLAAQGHTITRFAGIGDLQNFPEVIDAINTNDLVIISRATGSGAFDTAAETAAWNTSITKPLLSLGGYINRNNRLGFNTGDTIPDVSSNPVRLRVLATAHPIFDGLQLDGAGLMVNPYAARVNATNSGGTVFLQRGISVVTSAIRAGGSVLATIGTAGDAAINGLVIAEFPAGLLTHRDLLAAKRMVFLTGSREHDGGSAELAGIYDLMPDGEQLFLSTVNYLLTPQVPRCTLPLVNAVNLVPGDTWTFNAGVIGDEPLTYQWYKNGAAIPDGTTATLTFASLTAADFASYYLIVTNPVGSATSTVGTLTAYVFPPTSITNGLISYWPLEGFVGNKAVDLVSSYDMTAVNMGPANVVPGRWGNAMQFDATPQTLLERLPGPGEGLPIYQHPNFTVSLWVQGGIQGDRRVYSEGSTTNAQPLFNLGTHNTGANGSVDIYIRNDTGVIGGGNHLYSTATAFDFINWHHILYVQRDVGGGQMRAQLYVDGVLDPVVIPPVRPMTVNAVAIGGIRRASPSAWFTGLIDEVAVWDRALSEAEIGILQVTSITNPPVRTQPLAISQFRADLSTIAAGGSTVLRWDVSKDASQVLITPLGDVTGDTIVGVGSRVISPGASTTYVLSVIRGSETLSATTSVAVITGVASGWNLLENFDQSALANLAANGYWSDATGNSGQIITPNSNRALRTATANAMNYLNLRNLTINENQGRTLFFRLIPGAANSAALTNIVGLTDKSMRGYGDCVVNIGPVLYIAAFTNDVAGVETNGWYIGARNGWYGANTSAPIDYTTTPLEAGAVYNVWINVTNQPLGEFLDDTFSVYIAKEGDATRTLLFDNYRSDRDPWHVDVVLGGMLPILDKLIVLGNNASFSALFDDFYLSASGYLNTVPRPYGYTGPQPGPLAIQQVGDQLQIQWSDGVLQNAPTAEGPFTDVPGNPTSPYPVTPSGAAMFYRSRL